MCLAFVDFLPKLRATIHSYTNVTQARKSLKRLRHAKAAQAHHTHNHNDNDNHNHNENNDDDNNVLLVEEDKIEMALWEEMKVKIMVGMMGTAHCRVLLYLLLYIQWHLLLQPHDDHHNDDDNDDDVCVRQLVLSRTLAHFFDTAVPNILRHLQIIIQKNISHWNVMECMEMSLSHFHHEIQSIQHNTTTTTTTTTNKNNNNNNALSSFSSILQFIIPTDEQQQQTTTAIPTNNNDNNVNDNNVPQVMTIIVNLTWDMLESPTFADAQNDSISVMLDLLQRFGYSQIFVVENNNSNDNMDDNSQLQLMSLANVLSQIKQTVLPTFYNYNNNVNGSPSEAMKNNNNNNNNEWTIISSLLDMGGSNDNNIHTTMQNHYPNIYISEIEKIPAVWELGNACLM